MHTHTTLTMDVVNKTSVNSFTHWHPSLAAMNMIISAVLYLKLMFDIGC